MREELKALRACDAVLRLTGLLVPGDRRLEWLREWRAELWHEATRLEKAGLSPRRAGARLLSRSLGMLPDAVAVRRYHPLPIEEDLGSALRVVLRSPAAAGTGAFIVALTVGVDTLIVTMSRLTVLLPADMGALLMVLAAALAALLPLAASAAAAAAGAWSEAGLREEILRRAMGMSESRVRRQRALQGVLVGLIGSCTGIWFGTALLERFQRTLAAAGADTAVSILRSGPQPSTVALVVTLATSLALAFSAARRRPLRS